jgi:sulfate/thiosulfate-binding protein
MIDESGVRRSGGGRGSELFTRGPFDAIPGMSVESGEAGSAFPEDPGGKPEQRPEEREHAVDRHPEDPKGQEHQPGDRVEEKRQERDRPAEDEEDEPQKELHEKGYEKLPFGLHVGSALVVDFVYCSSGAGAARRRGWPTTCPGGRFLAFPRGTEDSRMTRTTRTTTSIAALAMAAAAILTPPARGAAPAVRHVVFYGFSILGEPMQKGIFPEFQQYWQKKTGERVEFTGSFSGSGTVTNQIAMGAPAQIALLSLELDAERLAASGATAAGSWKKLPHEGIVNRTPFVILVRPGNPKKILDFEDLARPGIKVVHPDPQTSGGANWAILAEYGAGQRAHPADPQAGFRLLRGLWKNVVAQAASARAARTQFENGYGDALVTYEQEAVLDRSRGTLKLDVVYPRRTVMSEHTLVLVDRNLKGADRALADAFAAYLWSDAAQRIFVKFGFRSVDERLNAENAAFGKIAEPFFVRDFGGWKKAKAEIIDAIWKDRVMKNIRH